MSPLKISKIIELLQKEYGNIHWVPRTDPLSELILTILSQNTSDHNSRRAFDSLLNRFGSWEAVAEGKVEDVAEAIKFGGLAQVKAPRIKMVLQQIREQRGSLDIMFLKDIPVTEAKQWLRDLPGVGPKTVACVLLFALGKPVLPVDTHVHRVAQRLGLIGSRVSAEKAHELLGGMVPAKDVYQFHMHMIEHGRRVCKSQRPRCSECALLKVCPTGEAMRAWIVVRGSN